jgi:tRNA pseudouridine38-40 synthase
MRNVRLTLCYEGTDFAGWQRQPGKRTVQEVVELALAQLLGERVRLLAGGRTDAGVHALGQVANFRTHSNRSPEILFRALNATLPPDVRVLQVDEVPLAFHATYDARQKLYRYVFHDGSVTYPWLRRFVAQARQRLDVEPMSEGARWLCGTHDFSSFETFGAQRASSVRTIRRLAVFRSRYGLLWEREPLDEKTEARADGDFVYLEVMADGFLYNMVRAIAGTLYNVGRGFWPPSVVREILEAKDRRRAGPTAPACGLYLVKVWYEDLSDGAPPLDFPT